MKRIQTLLYATGIVAALGFGSASAFATPTMARTWAYCPFQREAAYCADCCEASFNTYVYDFNSNTGECRCLLQ